MHSYYAISSYELGDIDNSKVLCIYKKHSTPMHVCTCTYIPFPHWAG